MLKRTFFLLITILVLSTSLCFADSKEIIAEGTYNMGDGETPQIAEERALTQAKQNAMEQAGTYIESYSETNNFQLTKDEVRVISSGIISSIVIDKNRTVEDGGGFQFWVKIKAVVSTDNIKDMVSRMRQLSTVDEYNTIQQTYDKLNSQHSNQSEINAANEQEWLANHWLDVGMNQYLTKDYKSAIDSFTKSYNLNKNETAIILLGDINYEMKNAWDALKWYEKANQSEIILFKEGLSNEQIAIEAINLHSNATDMFLQQARKYYYQALQINPKNPIYWVKLAFMKEKLDDIYPLHEMITYKGVLDCYTYAISLESTYAPAYYHRAVVYEKMNQPFEAAKDYEKFINMTDSSNENYDDAQQRLQNLKNTYGIM
jgi:tetratricopeptide (TPR) repeat protein